MLRPHGNALSWEQTFWEMVNHYVGSWLNRCAKQIGLEWIWYKGDDVDLDVWRSFIFLSTFYEVFERPRFDMFSSPKVLTPDEVMTAYNMKRSRSTCHSVSLSLNLPICSSASAKNTNPIRGDIRVDWCIVRRSGWRQFSNNSFIRSTLGE